MTERWEEITDGAGRRISIWNTEKKFCFITNLAHPLIREAYDRRCRELGVSGLTKHRRVAFDLEQVERFGIDERTPRTVRFALRDPFYTDRRLTERL